MESPPSRCTGSMCWPVDGAGEDSDCGRDAGRTRRVLSSIGAEVDSQRLANPVAIRSVDERTGFSMSIEFGLAVGDWDAEGGEHLGNGHTAGW